MTPEQEKIHALLLKDIEGNTGISQRAQTVSNYVGFIQGLVGLAQAKKYEAEAEETARLGQAG